MTLLTFIIPVRHQDNANWGELTSRLSQTMASIAAQRKGNWQAVIVANEGAHLPRLPDKFKVERVGFSANLLHDRASASREEFLDAFRGDKGRRVLAGMLAARDSKYFMIVDDDDFVSNQLVEFVAANTGANGWKIDHGYVWGEGGNWLYRTNRLNGICGTSLIIRADLYGLPERFENGSEHLIKALLGSHLGVPPLLSAHGTPLAALPFPGAIYRVGNIGSHSKTPGIFKKFFFNKLIIMRPWTLIRNIVNLRKINASVKDEFFAGINPCSEFR